MCMVLQVGPHILLNKERVSDQVSDNDNSLFLHYKRPILCLLDESGIRGLEGHEFSKSLRGLPLSDVFQPSAERHKHQEHGWSLKECLGLLMGRGHCYDEYHHLIDTKKSKELHNHLTLESIYSVHLKQSADILTIPTYRVNVSNGGCQSDQDLHIGSTVTQGLVGRYIELVATNKLQ